MPQILFVVFFHLVAGLFSSCTSNNERSIDYLGQTPATMKAERFAPGSISTNANEHSAIAFAPDGSVVLWAVMDSNYKGHLLEMKYANGSWSKPTTPSFSDTSADHYSPTFSADGKTLFFCSRRMASGYPEGSGNRIWSVEKTSDGWGSPVPFDTTVSKAEEFALSISGNGTLYFSSALGSVGTSLNICKAEKTNDTYGKPTLLPYSINTSNYEDGPYISPDEDFLIFESTRAEGIAGSHDLYISFKTENNQWSIPINMGSKINSESMERFPRLSPDGKYLFFASNRDQSAGKVGFDIYWIDAKVINELRNTRATTISKPLGDNILNAIHDGDSLRFETLLNQWMIDYPGSLDALVMYSTTLRKQRRFAEAERMLVDNATLSKENTTIITETALVKFGMGKNQEATQLLSPILMKDTDLRHRYLVLANALFDMNTFDASDEYFQKAMTIHANGVEYYNRACAYAHHGEKQKAFENLNKAADNGFNARRQYENDPDLATLKSDGRFRQLLEKLK